MLKKTVAACPALKERTETESEEVDIRHDERRLVFLDETFLPMQNRPDPSPLSIDDIT
jgi:hypothetical protein